MSHDAADRPPIPLLPHPAEAVVCAHPVRTAATLTRHVARVAAALGPVVAERAVLCQGRYAFCVGLLACWSRGETVVLPLNHTPAVLAALLDRIPVLVDGDGPGWDVRPVLDEDDDADAVLTPLRRPAPDQVLVRLSTSGSTGDVRLHAKTAAQLLGEADALAGVFLRGPRAPVVVATIPPHHIYGLLFGVLLPLVAGGAFHDDTPLFPEAVGARVRGLQAGVLVTVPAHLRTLTDAQPVDMASVRTVFSSGAPLPGPTADAMRSRFGVHVTEVFGSTETGGIAWRRRADGEAWTPLPGVTVTADADGRLLLASPFTAASEPRPRPCDDRIAPLPDGRFLHLGRLDDVVKVASKRVSLGSVTQALLSAPGVTDAVVVATDAPGGRTLLHALVVAADADVTTVRRFLRDRFDAVAVPRLHLVPALPRDAQGKLPRARVMEVLAARTAERAADVAPPPTQIRRPLVVPPEGPWYDGHFPDAPVLPGVALLAVLVLPALAEAWPDLGPCHEVRRVRFREVLAPGDHVTLSATRDGASVRFDVRRDDRSCTSGTLGFAPPVGLS
ncbi:MAG: AMP-binding protein [Alphaproteobacteria bacterium]|nr:AMP-binding protein [Alphaproteobacteria bacterium]